MYDFYYDSFNGRHILELFDIDKAHMNVYEEIQKCEKDN